MDSPFVIKVTLGLGVMVVLLFILSINIEASTARFGLAGWFPLILGVLSCGAGIVVAWASTITWMDRRALRRYRVSPDQIMQDGQTVALSGHIIVEGKPLTSPFSKTTCAGYSYQITGQKHAAGGGDSTRHDHQQLCLLGFHLAKARLDCGSHQFPITAIANVDIDLRNTSIGGDWGERSLALIKTATNSGTQVDEQSARDAFDKACNQTTIPSAQDFYVAPDRGGSNKISVIEDILPVDRPVTILANYQVRSGGLDGRRFGGLKCFAGHLDERLAELDKEWKMGLKVGTPLLLAGLALLTLARWWPA